MRVQRITVTDDTGSAGPPRVPCPLVPTPAAYFSELHGTRIIVGRAGSGWRSDVYAAGDPVVRARDGRVVVHVLSDFDFWRVRLREDPQFADRAALLEGPVYSWECDIDDVFVPRPLERDENQAQAGRDEPDDDMVGGLDEDRVRQRAAARPVPDLLSRLVKIDAPPVRMPVSAREAPRLTGQRLVVPQRNQPDVRDVRATSEPFETDDGAISVLTCPERAWWRWTLLGEQPTSTAIPIYLVWIE